MAQLHDSYMIIIIIIIIIIIMITTMAIFPDFCLVTY